MYAAEIIKEFEKKNYSMKIRLGNVESETRLKCGRGRNAVLVWEGTEIYMGYLACAIEEGKVKICDN